MSMMDSGAWTGGDQTMAHGADDDFQFLDIGGIAGLGDGLRFDFPELQNATGGSSLGFHHQHPQDSSLDTPMAGTDAGSATSHASIPTHMVAGPPPTAADAIVEIDAQIQYLQQQRLQQQQRQLEEQYYVRQARMVPPTPQSLELQPGNAQFYGQSDPSGSQSHTHQQQQQHQQAVFERFPRLKDQQDISFTPLVSPAVTPLETQYPVEGTQFTVPGVYFSPLTSPALHAQTEGAAQHYEQMCPVQASHSPTEMDTDDGPVLGSSSGDSAKKGRKSTTAPKPRGKQGLGKSPISRPQQKRKTASSSTAITSQIITELKESGQGSLPLSSLESENDSVSPENVSDMPPPPMPQSRSAGQSPYVQPQTKAGSVVSEAQSRLKGKPSPATPASLMNLTSPNVSGASVVAHPGHDRTSAAASDVIENFELPPPSAALPPKHATSKADSAQQSPALVAGAKVGSSSAFQPLPSPAFAMPRVAASTSQSPQLLPGSGSTGSSTTPTSSTSNPWKTPQMTARGTGGSGGGTGSGGGGSKKRSSVVSTQASPALRPRISPNIKPLLPASGPLSAAAEDTASRLLMTKSNYQNIIEGNAVPGVSYPSELSTNLTQKRTNHKIAEQGRRNRINSALQEIATLLPPSVIAGASSSGGGKGGEGGDNGDNMAGGATTDDGAYSGEAGKQQQRPPAGGDNKSTGKKAASTQAHQTPNSKASTVELAIEYIKQLKKEVAEATRRAEEAERKLSLQKNAARPSTESGATQADCPLESGVSSTSTCGKTP